MFENGIIRADPLSARPIDLWKKYVRQGRICEPGKSMRFYFCKQTKKFFFIVFKFNNIIF